MDYIKVGLFIKKLREDKNWSQEILAGKLHCDRTKINKIENGNRYVKLDDVILLSEIFNVSVEEIIAGEKKEKNNQQKIEIKFKEYLKLQNTKIKKLKLSFMITLILLIIIFLLYTAVYFVQNYKTFRIYKFSGTSENYEVNEGLLIISKDNIYLTLGSIVPSVDEISLFIEENNKSILIYSGDKSGILNDYYGYSSIISYSKFISGKQKMYMMINEERIDLDFKEDFINSKLFYLKKENISNNSINNKDIPKNIINNFLCEDNICSLDINNEKILFNNGILSVIKKDEYYYYDMDNKLLEYQNNSNNNLNFVISINDDEIICISGNCDNSKEIYNNFNKLYILKYLI